MFVLLILPMQFDVLANRILEEEQMWIDLTNLANDFTTAARSYGKIIIEEQNWDDNDKTIKSLRYNPLHSFYQLYAFSSILVLVARCVDSLIRQGFGYCGRKQIHEGQHFF